MAVSLSMPIRNCRISSKNSSNPSLPREVFSKKKAEAIGRFSVLEFDALCLCVNSLLRYVGWQDWDDGSPASAIGATEWKNSG